VGAPHSVVVVEGSLESGAAGREKQGEIQFGVSMCLVGGWQRWAPAALHLCKRLPAATLMNPLSSWHCAVCCRRGRGVQPTDAAEGGEGADAEAGPAAGEGRERGGRGRGRGRPNRRRTRPRGGRGRGEGAEDAAAGGEDAEAQ
jgi:hypothetical protein